MLDPVTQLAYAIQAKPGGYVVLLGSGASRAAGIPTAWEVVEELIRRLPEAQEAGVIDNPVNWYQESYGDDIRFSALLEQLAPNLNDRANILRLIVGDPIPTEAHKALAVLAKAGFIRIILTTNYDSLVETALYNLDLDPVVVSGESAATGVEPFHQITRPVVFKIHGDFNQPGSMLATEHDLSSYRHGVRRLLKTTLEDYGLIVVGWSGHHDVALLRALQARRSKRYPFWYVYRERLPDPIQRFRDARDVLTLSSTSADQFFSELERKVTAISTYTTPHPDSVEAISAELKLLLRDSATPLSVYDLISKEVESCYRRFVDQDLFVYSMEDYTAEEYDRQALRMGCDYLGTTNALAHLMAIGCAWTGADHHDIWKRAIERIANLPTIGADEPTTHTYLRELRNFPWLLLLYSGSIAAISRENIDMLRVLCRDASIHGDFSKTRVPLMDYEPLAYLCCKGEKEKAMLTSLVLTLKGQTPHGHNLLLTPISETFYTAVREPVRHLIPDDEEYDECFDRSELLFNLIAADIEAITYAGGTRVSLIGWPLTGPWPGRYSRHKGDRSLSMIEQAENEMISGTPFWRSVDKALFDDNGDRREAALECIKQRRQDWGNRGFGPRYGI